MAIYARKPESGERVFIAGLGQPGKDGFSPKVSVIDIPGGHQVTITDAGGAHWFNVMDGQDGSGGSGDGVASFNGRTGAVTPQEGDYSAAMVGARPDSWTPSAYDVGARPDDWTPSAADVGAIPIGEIQRISVLSQSEYSALSSVNSLTLYLIKE